MTEPTPSETALSAEEWELLRRILDAPPFGHQIKGDPDEGEWRCTNDDETEWETAEQHIARIVFRGAFPFVRAERASRSATEESLRAALDECRQHHADTLAGNERGQHRSATEGRRSALPNDGRCAAQAETIHGWVQCTKPPLHEDRHVWGDDNRVTPAEPFA